MLWRTKCAAKMNAKSKKLWCKKDNEDEQNLMQNRMQWRTECDAKLNAKSIGNCDAKTTMKRNRM